MYLHRPHSLARIFINSLQRLDAFDHNLAQIALYSWRYHQLIQIPLIPNPLNNHSPAPILQINKIPLHHPQRHLRFGCSRADHRIERLLDLVQPSEGNPETPTVLVVGQSAGYSIEEDADDGGLVLLEWLSVVMALAAVPNEASVGEAPSVVVLPN